MPVLVSGHARRDSTELMGRTECNRIVNFKGHERLMHQIIPIRITEAYAHSLRGEVPVTEDLTA